MKASGNSIRSKKRNTTRAGWTSVG